MTEQKGLLSESPKVAPDQTLVQGLVWLRRRGIGYRARFE